MKIIPATGGIAGTNCYLIADESTGQCVLFDAPDHTVAPLLEAIEQNGWDLIGLWLTHGHFDHIADHQIVTEAYPDAEVKIHRLDEPKLITPTSRLFQLPFAIPPGKADNYVEDGQQLRIGDLSCRVIFTPGHAPGHVCYYFEAERVLVGGDLIIGGAIGRYDLPDSNLDDLISSIRTIMRLPPDTRLLPGHGTPSTLGDEVASNPYVRQILESGGSSHFG
jgi:glyoxylase-like metal-dependent hydrolase (beta-lactamase superfamily II)